MFNKSSFLTFVATGAMVAGATLAAFPAGSALALPAPIAQPTASMASATQLPTVQIDGVAWSQVVIGNSVYVAGRFTNARPAGAAAGTNQTTRRNMLSYNVTTGALNTAFAPDLNNQAYVVVASPDGSRVYVGGTFTTANGVTRNRIAAYNTATGALITTFAPSLNNSVRGIAVTNDAVYVGGNFTTANSVGRNRLAAFNPTTGALLNWNPNADRQVHDLVMTPDGTKVIAGGGFENVGGLPRLGLVAISATTGVPQPWAINNTIYNHGVNAAILSLDVDDNAVYGTGYVYGSAVDGNLEGSFSANPNTGEVNWVQNCHGDHYDVWSSGSVVYNASHAHYCTPGGGFPQSEPWSINMRYATAFSAAATGTNGRDEYAGGTYHQFEGTPSPTMYNWFPDLSMGTVTGQNQAAWSISGNDQYVVFGGEFPRVNGVNQAGLVRFKVPAAGELTNPPRLSGAQFVPSVIGTGVGKVRIAWQTNWDRDDLNLTYRLVRNNATATPIYTTTAASTFWNRPNLGYVDSGLTPGVTYQYRVYVLDPSGNSIAGNNVSIVAPTSSSISAYDQRIIDDGAHPYWSLGESSGSVAIDSAGFDDGVVGTGVTRGVAGSTIGFAGTASRFNGMPEGLLTSQNPISGPNQFTVSSWFKTTTTTGGKIIGFGNAKTGTSGAYDRHVYMGNDGRIWFGVYPNDIRTLNSSASYNDGQWHQVVASLGSDGMKLSIDGRPVASRSDVVFGQDYMGYWRVGGDNLDAWPDAPSSRYFNGDIDNVAFFPNVLTRTQIRNQYLASGRTLGAPAPVDNYGADVYNDDPDLYWRLADPAGSTSAADSGSYANTGSVAGVTFNEPGGVLGTSDTAADFNGSSGVVVSQTPVTNPTVYTEEAWFKTTTTTGGKIIGFGTSNSPTTPSTSYDRHVYMQDNGTIVFGTYTGQTNTATSQLSYNDGQWHYVAATQGPDGMKLYVDGTLVGSHAETQAEGYTGYWRIGGDPTWSSTSQYFDGAIDEAAVYSKVLSPTDIAQRYTLGSGQTPNIAPNPSFTSNVSGLNVSFDASASNDPDGSITSYSWNFGDGTTAGPLSSPLTSHTYTTGDTYTVTLTITDNGNVTTFTTRTVAAVDAYGAAVAADSPFLFWRLGELSGNLAADASGNNRNGTYQNGVGRGAVGPLAGGTSKAAIFDGNDDFVVSNQLIQGPAVYSEEAWFKTTSNNAGKIIGFGCSNTGTSGCYDRHIYMDSGGLVTFGVWTGFTNTITTTTPLNDGQWHQVVGTQDGTGLKLYVDGALVGTNGQTQAQGYDGYWRVGGDNHWGGGSPFLAGTIANVAVYSTALPAARVAAHYQAATNVTPQNQIPTAAFTFTTNLLTANFNSTASFDPEGPIASRSWDFGDGATSTDVNPTHTYAAEGNYNVTLTVTDNLGATDSDTQLVSVSVPNVLPVASFTSSSTNLNASFTSTATDSDGTITAHSWDFGDGTPASTATNPTHAYGTFGNFSVTLTVTDNDGGQHSASQTVAITNAVPTAAFSTSTSDLQVTFTSASTDTDGTIATHSWDFGDSTPVSTETNPVHTYAATGNYTVVLTVTDNQGGTDDVQQVINVQAANAGPTATFTSTTNGLTASFDATDSIDPDGSIASYAWLFGDGGTGSTATPSHTYAATGVYTVQLTVTDNRGGTASFSDTVSVTAPANQSPTAAFTFTTSGLTANFNSTTSSDPEGPIASRSWDFGDGTPVSTAISPSHTYAANGNYTVVLTVTDGGGATDTDTQTVGVTAPVGPVVVATDTFTRTQATGLGTADLGGAWTLSGASNLFSVSTGMGRIRMATAGVGPAAYLNTVSARDVNANIDVSLDKAATGGGVYVSLLARRVGNNDYRARLRYQSNGTVQLLLSRNVNGTETVLRTITVAGLTVVPNDVLRLEFEVTGTTTATLSAKVWRASQAEPAAWQSTITDSTASLNTAGGIGVFSYLSGTSTNAPVVTSIDNVSASRLN